MKKFKTRVVLLFVLITFVSIQCSVRDKKVNGAAHFFKHEQNQLRLVIGGENKNNPKIYYKGRDYTSYVQEFLNLKPMAIVTDHFLILSKSEIKLQGSDWVCDECIVIYFKETEYAVIEATGVSYSKETNSLTCSNAVMQIKKLEKK